jgi:8-oxo-dGTP pyrophosphatase MutT (NUDIX family)
MQELRQRAQQNHDSDAVAFKIGDAFCGYATRTCFDALSTHLPEVIGPNVIRLSMNNDTNDKLAQIAMVLQQVGLIKKWRDELLDVWHADQSLGAIERGAVRPLGLLTRAVHLNAWSSTGELWVARRDLRKPTDPGMWDTLVGGLVGYAEDDALALERESAEEAGLSPKDLTRRESIRSIFRMQRRVDEGFQCEEVLTSDCLLEDHVKPSNQDGEVMTISCLPITEIKRMLFCGEFTLEASIVITESLLRRSQQ